MKGWFKPVLDWPSKIDKIADRLLAGEKYAVIARSYGISSQAVHDQVRKLRPDVPKAIFVRKKQEAEIAALSSEYYRARVKNRTEKIIGLARKRVKRKTIAEKCGCSVSNVDTVLARERKLDSTIPRQRRPKAHIET